jgi:hypothetical protein
MNIIAFSMFSVFMSVFAILIVISFFRKFYEQEQRRPWIFIGVCTIMLGLSEFLKFLHANANIVIVNSKTTDIVVDFLLFVAVTFLTFGLFLESLIVKFLKEKYVKIKFIPVTEGSSSGDISLNVNLGDSYLANKVDKNHLLREFSEATKKGYEGFLITESSPKDIRKKYELFKTPICWIREVGDLENSKILKHHLDERSDICDPLELNNLISYLSNFLEQSQKPFIMLEINTLLRKNNYSILNDFLHYLTKRIEENNGILICFLSIDIENVQLENLKDFLLVLEE